MIREYQTVLHLISRRLQRPDEDKYFISDHSVHSPYSPISTDTLPLGDGGSIPITGHSVVEESYAARIKATLVKPIAGVAARAGFSIYNEERTSLDILTRIEAWNTAAGSLFGTNQVVRPLPPEMPVIDIPHPLIIISHGLQMLRESKKMEAYAGIQSSDAPGVNWHVNKNLQKMVNFYLSPVFSLDEFQFSSDGADTRLSPFFHKIAFLSLPEHVLLMHRDKVVANLLTKHIDKYASIYSSHADRLVANHYLFADHLAGTLGNWIGEICVPPLREYLNRPKGFRDAVRSPGGHTFVEAVDLGDDGYADILYMQNQATTLYDVLKILYWLRLKYTSIRLACCRGHIFERYDVPNPYETDIKPSGQPPPSQPPGGLTLTLPARKRRPPESS